MIEQIPVPGIQSDAEDPNYSGHIQTIIDSLPTQIGYKDHADRFLFVNEVFCNALGKPRDELIGGGMWADLFPREEARDLREWDLKVMESGKPVGVVHQVKINGDRRWVRIDRAPYFDAKGNIIGTVGSAIDLTPMIKSREALPAANREAEGRANEQARPAEGLKYEPINLCLLNCLIPICSVCKKIRDEDGQWHILENYFTVHTGTRFTHGYCPKCAEKMLHELQPIKTVCKRCGCDLEITRYVIKGRHFRRYSCPECGYSQEWFLAISSGRVMQDEASSYA